MLSKTISIAKAAKTTVTCPFCVYVWELWFVRIIHSQTRSFNPLEQSFFQFRAWFGLFMQIMLHVPLVVDQVLYAYHKKRKAGTIPKNVLNCWIDLFFWFFFLSSGIFQLWVTPVSVTGGLQTVLGCSLLWRYIGRANNSCGLESSPSPAYLRLADEGTFPRRGLHSLTLESSCPSFLPFPLPALTGGGFFLPW